jgi:hypothetical protein
MLTSPSSIMLIGYIMLDVYCYLFVTNICSSFFLIKMNVFTTLFAIVDGFACGVKGNHLLRWLIMLLCLGLDKKNAVKHDGSSVSVQTELPSLFLL